MNIETERKFLIESPDISILENQPGFRKRNIVQTYLIPLSKSEKNRRVRCISENGHVSYTYAVKRKISVLSREENEFAISESEYESLKHEAVSELTKTRYSFPYSGHTIEIDVYAENIGKKKLKGKAVLEIELKSESEQFEIPDFINVLAEITGNGNYSNMKLAQKIQL